MDDRDRRYAEIMRRIAARKAQSQTPPPQTLAVVLDNLNAYDTLDAYRQQHLDRRLSYGPGVFEKANWAGVLVWNREAGYHGYKTLHITGIWAQLASDDCIEILVGRKTCAYTAPVYSGDAYRVLMHKSFSIYYQDDGGPPEADGVSYRVAYDPAQRLAIREAISIALTG